MVETIDEVLDALDAILAQAERDDARIGYFPALYRKVTARVQQGIQNGEFDDGPRMERLDVVFARRYLDAHAAWSAGESPTKSWALAFEKTAAWRPIVLQHLLGGINAHINLDLGIAAAEVGGSDLASLKDDFDRINTILAELTDGVKQELGQIWPILPVLDWLAGQTDDRVIEFSMGRAREAAWDFAVALSNEPRDRWPQRIHRRDEVVHALGVLNYDPGITLTVALLLVRLGELDNPRKVIQILR